MKDGKIRLEESLPFLGGFDGWMAIFDALQLACISKNKYSVELLLLQLEKFRKISLADGQIADGQIIDIEMTKEKREIIQALNLCA